MHYDSVRAHELLRLGTQNSDARFRDGQEKAIRYLVERHGRLLVVQKTGWGKSAVYFIASKLLREQGSGPILLISPLLALMRNQIAGAERMGVRALAINSENRNEWDDAEKAIARDEIDIVLISPERLSNGYFRSKVLGPTARRIALLVVDEAHCISDWGHDFRPHYRLIDRVLKTLPAHTRVLATTATANDRVLEDLQRVLGPNLKILRGELCRSSLLLQTIRMPSQAERMAWLATHLPTIEGSGIIYTLTIRDAMRLAEWLRTQGVNVQPYTGESGERRVRLEQDLLENRVKALVATSALGMGFDKPDLSFVIHFQMPGSVVAYYQQVGRAGRGLDAAYGVLLCGEEEREIAEYFIEGAFPSKEEVADVLAALKAAPSGLSLYDLMNRVNAGKLRIERALMLMSLESPAPILLRSGKWRLTGAALGEQFWDRIGRLTELRWEEHRQMRKYVDLKSGHMEFLVRALDGDPGSYRPPEIPPLPTTVDPDVAGEAAEFLGRTSLVLSPRRSWPTGGLPKMRVRGKIPFDRRARPGRALCVWGDSEWGELVRRGKYVDGRFSDELVEVCATLVRSWAPRPAPTWITCIPSRRHPDLVPDLARRLAIALQMPYIGVLEKTDDRPEQKGMANGIQQARNVDGSLAVRGRSIPSDPVLLVDDMIDSKWTMTVAAYLLTSHGSGPVYPLVLASTSVTI